MSASNKRSATGSRSPARSNTSTDLARRMRIGLLGSTALIAAGLACSPAFAQTVASPAGGGTISRTGGSDPTVSDQTGSGGGLNLNNVDQDTLINVNGVTINNTTGVPILDALRIAGLTSSLNSTGVALTGVNNLTTTRNNGAGLMVTTNANMGVSIASSGSTFTGSYGINLQAPSGFISFNAANQSQSFVANGTHIAGFNAVGAVNADIRLGSSTFTGFDTGINSSNFFGSTVVMTGGSINALVTGIRTDATGGHSNIQSQAAIVAPTGIHSTNTLGAEITTSGAGTINSTSNGVGTGIIATSSGGTNLDPFTINVGAAIGNITAFATGVDLSTTGSSTNSINLTTTAAITATGRAISATAGTFGNTGTFNLGANVTGATGVYTNVGNYTINVAAGVTVHGNGAGGSNAGMYLVNGTITLVNNGTISYSGTGFGASGIHLSSNGSITNSGTGLISGDSGIWFQNVASVNNAGTITGTGLTAGTGGIYGSSGANVINTGTITGYDGVYSGGNPTTHDNSGTITGVAHGYNLDGGRVTLTNSGAINTAGGTGGAGLAGLRLNTTFSPNTLTNSGTISGGGDATHGFGVEIVDGAVTLTNQLNGVITGGIGGVWLASDDLATLNLNLGSTVTGQIQSTSTGARTATIAGLLDGAYNAAAGSGVDTITLASTGSITGAVTLGAGDDVFNWQGGAFTTINAGTGTTDVFNATLGAGVSGTLSLSNLSNFDAYNLVSGNLTLTGTRASGAGWSSVPATNLTLDGSLTVTTGSYGIAMNGNGSPATISILTGATLSAFNGVWFNTGASNNFSNAGTVTATGTGLSSNGALTATNTGTITASTGAAFSTGVSVSTMTNSGTLTGGSSGTGYGAYSAFAGMNFTNLAGGVVSGGAGGISAGINAGAAGLLTVSNASGGQIGGPVGITTGQASRLTLTNDGNVTGTNGAIAAAGTGATSITNNATGRIVSTGDAFALSTGGAATIINAGVIGTGTVTSGGVYTAGGSYTAIHTAAAGTIRNSGLIEGQSGGITADGTLDLRNTGTITALSLGNGGSKDAAYITGTATVLNSGTMSAGIYSAIAAMGANTVVTNAAGGSLQGGSDALFGVAAQLGGVNTTFNNYGVASSATGGGILAGDNAITMNLHAGSSTGNIVTRNGNDTLALYSGRGTSGAATIDGASGITLQNAGALAAATVGVVDLGGGTDTVQLRGTGDGTAANGAVGALDLSNSTSSTAEVLTKLDAGTWILNGAASVPGITINAGTGAPAGTLIFSGTSGLTGAINVNGALVRATTTTAFGTGTLHMIDPTAEFAATGTYGNDISLEVVNGQQSIDPTILRNTSGGTITLSGRIYETNGVGGANQYVTFDGAGTTILSNTGNVWGGVTAINSGTTLQGATNTISGGSIANAGALVFNQAADGTFNRNISGAGTLQVDVPTATTVTLSGVNTYSGATAITSGTLLASGGAAIGDLSAVTIASGATLQLANNETIGSLAGAGTARILGSSLTLGGNNTSTTFSGSITDQTPVAYVGSWVVSDGATWSTNPPTYTGQEAAALLFGGAAANYRLSTAGASTGTITDTAWYNRYGGNPNYVEAANNYRVDTGAAGYNAQQDTSAYVGDHTGDPHTNYAFTGGLALGGGLTKTGTGTLTLSGTNNYTGVTSITGGVLEVLNGSAISNLSVVNILSPGAFTVTNSETVASLTGTGATTVAGGQTLTLANGSGTYAGNITGGSLVLAGGSWTYGGTRSGGQSSALTMNGANTTLSVANAGSILGSQFIGVRTSGAGNTINNLGLIQNAGTGGDGTVGAAVFVLTTTGGTTTVNNGSITDTGAGSTIQGRNAGVRHEAGSTDLLVVNNYGLIVGDLYNGIENTAGGLTVNNFAGGYITALLGNGVSSASASAVSVTNAGVIGRNIAGNVTVNGYGVVATGALTLVNQTGGTIIGQTGGVLANNGGSITNQLNGLISGGSAANGVVIAAGATSVTNAGTISGVAGVRNNSAGVLTFANSGGAITGSSYGVYSTGRVDATITGGTITGGTYNAFYLGAANSSITNGGTLIAGNAAIYADGANLTVQNSGVIRQVGGSANTVISGIYAAAAGAQVTNTSTGLIESTLAGGRGVNFAAGGSVANAGTINGPGTGILNNGGALTVTNSGTIGSSGGYGVQNASATGASTITNQSGGVIGGATGSILLNGAGDTTINLMAGSTVNGQILSIAGGTHAVSIAGTLNGAYDAATGAGVDNLTLAVTGSMTSASLGAGADSFVYRGGAFSGLIDAGTGTDSFTSNLSGGVASANLSNLTNFETFAHQSGALTLTGTGAFSGGSSITGGSLVVNGTLQSAASVASGATLRGGGSITGAVTVANGGVLANTQGSTLTMGSLGLSSGSTINATFSGAGGPALFAVTGDLTLDGTVNVASSGAYGFGVYGLMTYGGVLTDNGLVIGTTPGGAQRVGVQTSVAGQINIVHAPTELLFWDGGPGGHDNGAVNGGSGTWTAAGSEWTDANGLFNGAMEPQPGFAIFQGAGGVVTVDDSAGAVGVTGMQFAADGYRIEGDSITLANANTTIRVGNGTGPSSAWTATIASALTGTGGLLKTDLGTLILAGDSDYTGGTIVNDGTLQIGEGATAGSIAGSVVLANSSSLIFARSDNHDFANDVSGAGTVRIDGVVTLSGAITASGGVKILDGASLTNAGVITASPSDAVTFANGGAFTNTGTVNGNVAATGAAAATVTNAGAINGTVYNGGLGLLTVDNQAGGAITAIGAAVISTPSGAVALNNAGDISGTQSAFASNNALDTVTNSGRIVGGSIAGAVVTQGTGDAIRLNFGGGVVNQAGGLISGGQGVASYAGVLTLDNQLGGTITGDEYGVHAYTAASIVNAGTIGATRYAGIAMYAGGTLTNSGTIGGGSEAGSNQGVTVEGATTIVNLAGGVINNGIVNFGSGLLDLDIQAGSTVNGSVFNSASGGGVLRLAGALNGNYSGSSGDDLVSLISGGTFSGVLQGNGGVDSFELAGAGAGSVDISKVLNFESRAMNGAGVWTLTGFDSSTVGWSINSGTLAVSGGQAINDAVAVTIAGPGTLQLNASERIGGLNGSGAVALGANTLIVGGGGSSTYAGVIGGTGNLQIASGSTLTLSGANTYGGATFITAGTLRLGASDVLSNASLLSLASGSFLDLQGFSDTVAAASLAGVVDGTGTLTAASYSLNGATINANLGGGNLFNFGGVSTLNGTSNAGLVSVQAGTLTLGGSNRLSDTAAVGVLTGATLNLSAFNDTVGVAMLNGTLAGTGTLTAGEYDLNGATVNANLGAGNLFNVGGVSTLNGVSGSANVSVQAGTLALGGSNRLADTANLVVASGSTLNLGAFNDTVGLAVLNGTLAGTGTLTAGEYDLNGAAVNANLGAGNLFNVGGVSTLTGTSGAANVVVQAGTLTLGASNRLADAATVSVASGSVLNLGAFNDTVGLAVLNGTLAGTGTLTATQYQLNGAAVNANLGAGNLFNVGGVSTLNGVSGAANVSVQAGTLNLGASNRLADTATVGVSTGATLNLGAFNDTVGLAVLNGTLAGTGTLTAGEYDLNGATINANLGAGNLFNVGGVSTLNGTSAAANVVVQAGTLSLGASNRLADTATVSVASGSTLNLNAFNDTVGLAVLNGTLNGAGTLTAAQYQLNAATVNANLGAGTLFNLGGVSTLNGTAAASQVSINAGTLRLGANERLSDAATVSVASGATFNVNGFNERIGALFGTGNVDVGAGRLTFGGVESGFGGRLSGAGSVVHTGGLFTLMGDHTVASISNTGGELRFLGATTGGLSASGGSVTGAGTIGGALTASNGAVLSPGLAGVQNGIGSFTAGGLTLNGGTLAIDVLGASGGNLIDQLRINGTATLTGGLLAPTFQGSAATDFNFSTRYLFLQANNLVGTFANGSAFTAATQPGLYWRVRYDLSPNAAVLELRELTNFDPGATGTDNQRGVGQALSGGQLLASDDWAATLSLIAGLSAADRAAALDSISGEPLADVTTSLFSANDSFLNAVRDGGLNGRDDGGEALNFVDRLSFAGGRENSADRLGDVLGAFDPSASTDRGAGGWVSAYAGDQTLDGKPGQATVESTLNGFAGGYGSRIGAMSIGAAGGVTRLEGDVASRQGHYESDLSHAAGYAAYDDGVWAADLTASFYGGDLDTRRGITVGAFHGQAIGNTHVEGQALSASVARRFQVSDNTMIALGAIGTASNASVDGYTEVGAGGLSLTASGQERDWQTLQLSARGTQDYRVNGQGFRIYAGAGVMAMAGDRQATGDMRFSGAPIGFGSFTVEGAETPPLAGLADFGLEVGAGEGVTLSAGYRGLFSERLQDNQVGVKLKVSW